MIPARKARWEIAVLGAGMVGVSSALELQRRGKSVTLIDQWAPGEATSYGNAGLLPRSSMIPLNGPTLFKSLPSLLQNRSNGLRYNPSYVARNAFKMLEFLWHARPAGAMPRIEALDGLMTRSQRRHKALAEEAGDSDRLRDLPWLKLYRKEASFKDGAWDRNIWHERGLPFDILNPDDIRDLEPGLKPIFMKGVLVHGNISVDDPGELTKSYADMFRARGGSVLTQAIEGMDEEGQSAWQIRLKDGTTIEADAVVIALGPWSKAFLRSLGLHLPMIYERGAHREYVVQGESPITHPINDAEGGYALIPMRGRMRVTCGVRLDDHLAPDSPVQISLVEESMREAVTVGPRTNREEWHGTRPTLPDCLPAIGRLKRQGLWIATGNQHIGFSTGPATGELLADLMTGKPTKIDAHPFRPSRYSV